MTDPWGITPDDLPLILIDTREQCPLVFSNKVRTQRATLAYGDYSIATCTEDTAYERKSLPDLIACCGRERARFTTELAHLGRYRHRAVVIEGSIRMLYAMRQLGALTAEQVWHSTVAMQEDYMVPFVWAGGARGAAAWVEYALLRVKRKAEEAAKHRVKLAESSPAEPVEGSEDNEQIPKRRLG